jgi:hypothetical protein
MESLERRPPTAAPTSRVKPVGVREAHGLDARCKGSGMLAAAFGNHLSGLTWKHGIYGVAPVGSPCSGMANDGLFYQGTSCYGDEQPSAVTMPPAPSFCCTAVGRFGPFPNPGWPEGSACWSQTVYGPMQGMACY